MSDQNEVADAFYARQRDVMNGDYTNDSRRDIHESWFDETTVDFWRQKRFFQLIEPLADEYRDLEWLTVGDGRYGLDSVRLKSLLGIKSVLPTDISDVALKSGKERGLFENYSVENIESLSFEKDSMDIVLCKESYHHLPRAMVGLYEMLRVARKAVILIEPQTMHRIRVKQPEKKPLLKRLKRAWRGDTPVIENYFKEVNFTSGYEVSGNYIYRISYIETEQVVRGLDLPGFAWKGFVDKHLKGAEHSPAVDGDPVFEETKEKMAGIEARCDPANPVSYPLAVAVIFVELPSEATLQSLRDAGFVVRTDTRNPILHGKPNISEEEEID